MMISTSMIIRGLKIVCTVSNILAWHLVFIYKMIYSVYISRSYDTASAAVPDIVRAWPEIAHITSSHMQNLVTWSHQAAKEPGKSSLYSEQSSAQPQVGNPIKTEKSREQTFGKNRSLGFKVLLLNVEKKGRQQTGIEMGDYWSGAIN